LGVSKFFRGFFPLVSLEDLREQSFALYYFTEGGVTYSDVEEMEASERHWHLKRLRQQKQAEADAMKKANAQAKQKKTRRRR
jgi:hypothetical protein